MLTLKLFITLFFSGTILGSPLSIFELIKPGGLIDDLKQVGNDVAGSTLVSRNPRESLSYAPSPVGAKTCEHKAAKSSFFVRVFSSCGSDCCDSTIKKRCTGIVIKEDTVLVAASCIVGYNCFKICYGSDLCGEREPCVNSKEAYVHPDYIDNIHLRLKMHDNIGMIKIPLLKQITPIPIAHFKTSDCQRFVDKNGSFKFIGCGDGAGTFPKIQREIGQKPVGGSELSLVYSISKNNSEPQPCCGDEGGPLVITGQDLIAQFGKELEPTFKKFVLSKGKLELYLIAILSYFDEPCDSKSQAVYTCLHPYQPILDGYACESWTHLSVAHDLLLSIDNDGLNAIDNIYSSKNLDIRVKGHPNSIRSLVQCIVDQRYEAIKEAKLRLEKPSHKDQEDNYQCGGRSQNKPTKRPTKRPVFEDQELEVSSFLPTTQKSTSKQPKKPVKVDNLESIADISEFEPPQHESDDEEKSAVKSEVKPSKGKKGKIQNNKQIVTTGQDSQTEGEIDTDSDPEGSDGDAWPFNLSPKSGDIFSSRDGAVSDVGGTDGSETTSTSDNEPIHDSSTESFRDTTELQQSVDESATGSTNAEPTGALDELSARPGAKVITGTSTGDTTGLPLEEGSSSHAPTITQNDASEGNGDVSESEGAPPLTISLLGDSRDDNVGGEEEENLELDENNEDEAPKGKKKPDQKTDSISEDDWVDEGIPGIDNESSTKKALGAAQAQTTEESEKSSTNDENSSEPTSKKALGAANSDVTTSEDDSEATTKQEKSAVGASLFKIALGDSQNEETTENAKTTKGQKSALGSSLDDNTELTTDEEVATKAPQSKLGASLNNDQEKTEEPIELSPNDAVSEEVLSKVNKVSKQALGEAQPDVPIDSEGKNETKAQALEQDEDLFDEDAKQNDESTEEEKLLSADEVIEQASEFKTNKLGASQSQDDEEIEAAVVEEQQAPSTESTDEKSAVTEKNKPAKGSLGAANAEGKKDDPGSEAGEGGSKICSVSAD